MKHHLPSPDEEVRATLQILDEMGPVSCPPGLEARVMSRLAAPAPAGRFRWEWAAAAILLLALNVFAFLGRPASSGGAAALSDPIGQLACEYHLDLNGCPYH